MDINNTANNTIMSGTADADNIINSGSNVTISGGAGDDTIRSTGEKNVVNYAAGDGNDTVYGFDIDDTIRITEGSISSHYADGNDYIIGLGNGSITVKDIGLNPIQVRNADGSATVVNYGISNYTNLKTVQGTSSADSIFNAGNAAKISAGAGNDYVINYKIYDVTIDAGAGDDTINNIDSNFASIEGGNGNDSIRNAGSESTVNGGAGNDSIYNDAPYKVVVNGGNGDDYISNVGTSVTLNGGAGNDAISLNGGSALINFASGDGNDTVLGFKGADTISITGTSRYSTLDSASDVIISLQSGSMLLKDAATLNSLNVVGGSFVSVKGIRLSNTTADSLINGSSGDDTINNAASNVTINAGKGNDIVSLSGNYSEIIEFGAGGGNDTVYNYDATDTIRIADGADYSTLQSGNDIIINVGSDSMLIKNAADKTLNIATDNVGNSGITVSNSNNNTLITGTAFNDSVYNSGQYATINTGAGNDSLYIAGDYNVVQFGAADGNDLVLNFSVDDTLQLTEGVIYSHAQTDAESVGMVRHNIVVNNDNSSGSIVFDSMHDYVPIQLLNADNTRSVLNYDSYNYNSNSELNGTENADSLFNGAAYSTVNALDGNDLIYVYRSDYSSINAGAGNDTVYNYVGNHVTINGGEGIDSIVNDSSLKIAIDAGAGDDSVINRYGTQSSLGGGDGNDYILNDAADSVSINAGAGNDYIFNESGSNVTINGGAGDDAISLNGGSALISYASGDGNDTVYNYNASDTIRLADGTEFSTLQSGNDVMINVGEGTSILLKEAFAFSQTLNIINSSVSEGINVSNTDSNTIVNGSDYDDTINNDADNVSIDAGDGNDTILSTGTSNTINGGKGNDYIQPAAEDVLIYRNGDGNDTIVGYQSNTINIEDGADYSTLRADSDVIISVGSGSMLLKDASDTALNIVGGNYVSVDSENTTSGGDDTTPNDDVTFMLGDEVTGFNRVLNKENDVLFEGDDSNDYLKNIGSNVTIQGNGGDDIIEGSDSSELIHFGAIDGNDTILNIGDGDTINIIQGVIDSSVVSGNDVIIRIKGARNDGSITLRDAANMNFKVEGLLITPDIEHDFINRKSNVKISGTRGRDLIENTGANVTVEGNGDDDTVIGSNYGELIMFGANDGNDYVMDFNTKDTLYISDGEVSSVERTENDLIIVVKGDNSKGIITLEGAGGYPYKIADRRLTLQDANTIINDKDSVTISGTDDADYIINKGSDVTIQAGAGNDTVEPSSSAETFLFGYDSGNDLLLGFDENDILKATSGSISNVETVGNDVVVTISKGGQSDVGKITIQNGAVHRFKRSGTDLFIDLNNYIDNDIDNLKINGTTDDDYISNYADNVTVQAGKGNDTLVGSNYGELFMFSYASGDDLITNFGKNDTLQCTAGSIVSIETVDKDTVITMKRSNTVGTVTLKNTGNYLFKQNGNYLTAEDANLIVNSANAKKVTGTTGNDYIINSGSNVTIQAGKGNDTLEGAASYGDRFLFSYASGDDLITNFDKNDTLQATSGTISAVDTVGNDVVVTIKQKGQSAVGQITLQGASSYRFKRSTDVLTVDDVNYITNAESNKKITGTTGKDSIVNSGSNVTIQAGKGNDTLKGSASYGERFQFSYASGNDVITNFDINDTLQATSGTISAVETVGNDAVVTIKKKGQSAVGKITLQGAGVYKFKRSGTILFIDDVNYITNAESNKKISGTTGKDSIVSSGSNVTMQAGKGNDTLVGAASYGDRFLFSYASGDDLITNFDKNDTLQATSGTISAVDTVDNNVVVTITKSGQSAVGHITLQGAGSYIDLIKRDDTHLVFDDVNASLNQTDNKKISGTAQRDYIKNVGANVTIDGAGGNDTVCLSDNPEVISFGAKGGNDLVSGFGKTDTLYIASGSIASAARIDNDYVVTVSSGKTSGHITLQGAGIYPFTVDEKKITVDSANVIVNNDNKKKVTGTKGRDYVTNTGEKVTIQAGAGNDTIYGSGFGDRFLFSYASGDDLIVNFDKNDTLQATDGTIGAIDTIGNDAVVTIAKSGQSSVGHITLQGAAGNIFNRSNTLLTVDNVNFIVNADSKQKITGTEARDLITNTGDKVTIQAGKGADTITGSYEYGERFLFSYASGNDVITNFQKNDTLQATAGTISAVEPVGNDAVVTITNNKTVGNVTLQGAGDYRFILNGSLLTAVPFNVIENSASNKKITGTTDNDSIISSGSNVTIQAGKGNDSITGSVFAETFMFSHASGDDIITNFNINDTIRNTSGTMTIKKSGNDRIITITKDSTSGHITLQGAGDLNLVKDGALAYVKNKPNVIVNAKDAQKITGSANNDYVINSGNNVTVQTGKGNDTIIGSETGAELFLFSYASGNDVVKNFGAGDTLRSTNGSVAFKKSGNDYVVSIEKSGQSDSGTITLQGAAANYTLTKNGSNLIASAKSTSAQLPSDDYWFLNETVEESPLSAIVEHESAVDLPSDFADTFKPTVELAVNARHRQNKSVK